MSGTRWLLLAVLAAIMCGIGVTYRERRQALEKQSPAKPESLAMDLRSSAKNWHWERTDGKPPFRKTVEITAKNFQQVKETARVDLEQVELKLYHKDGMAYDLVKSAAANFTATDQQLYSDGEVEITLGVPVEGPAPADLVWIKTSGVRFDSATGKAETDRPATFRFRAGEGKATGAIYDPTVPALEMKKEVEIDWRRPGAKPMKIEASTLQYYEATSEIRMRQWGKLTRGTSVIEGENSVVHLKDEAVERVEAERGRGTDTQPKRTLEYQAEKLWVNFNDVGQVEKVIGETAAKLVSEGEASRSTVTANRVELDFKGGEDDEAALAEVRTAGRSEMESRPKPVKGRAMPETHVLRSERIAMKMREGGREIESIVTETPGVVEFLPNLPAQRHRTLEGSKIEIAYGADNRLERFRATAARTRTEPNAEEKKRNRGVAVTASQELAATFEPKTSRMATLEQWGDFTYDEGDRKARAAKATMDSARNVMHLETGARVWDTTGSTEADRIRLDERSGDFTAEGRVRSSRMGEKKKPAKGAQSAVGEMLTGEDPLHALAERMAATNRNRNIKYTGKVTLWQGANRIQGDAVVVDREKRTLMADGNVVSQLWEQPKEDAKAKKKGGPPVLTVVRAEHLVYTDGDRLAHYRGGVRMTRPALDVKGRELRAWMAASGAESSLERAVADGQVVILQAASAGRTRTGTSEHAEYYTADQKIVLRGGDPQLVDSLRGHTKGAELTYFANDDRLLVNGVPDRPATSVIRKR